MKWIGTRTQLSALATIDPVVVDINPQLSATQKTELQQLVGVIIRQRPYRVPEARRQTIEEEVQEMLKLGVIESSRSPWSSPIMMVPKTAGSLRFCNNFCRLNEVSEFDGYLMPRVDELLDQLGRAQYISTLDLTKGYWQVAFTDKAKPKTAFSTPSGHWQYRTLPFGLHGGALLKDTAFVVCCFLIRPDQTSNPFLFPIPREQTSSCNLVASRLLQQLGLFEPHMAFPLAAQTQLLVSSFLSFSCLALGIDELGEIRRDSSVGLLRLREANLASV
ncbi:hypothetical protein QQF64_003341 [Cirrhinus molitorella]|uniref:ribonuclease H n=1 Tax=Cirrhinus molitorella TaxID=172907 RepID=A0ABR3ML12_9TELE